MKNRYDGCITMVIQENMELKDRVKELEEQLEKEKKEKCKLAYKEEQYNKDIKKLKSLLHLDYVYGIGDSYNDIPMLESADCSFTFYDSPEIVQKEATHLVSSICEAIERIERE